MRTTGPGSGVDGQGDTQAPDLGGAGADRGGMGDGMGPGQMAGGAVQIIDYIECRLYNWKSRWDAYCPDEQIHGAVV